MNEDTKREIDQLWNASEIYFSLVLKEKKHIRDTDMRTLKVKDLTDKKVTSKLQNFDNIILFTIHLSSCAIRLSSIDENFKKIVSRGRLHIYNELTNDALSKEEMKTILKNDLSTYIHFLLRHMTCHAEFMKCIKPAFDKLYSIYLNLTLKELFDSMKKLKDNIDNDINNL